MKDYLKELRDLHKKYKEKEIREELAGGLYNAAYAYGSAKALTKMEGCLKELRDLHKKYKEKEIREDLAKGLYNAVNAYGSANDFAIFIAFSFSIPKYSFKKDTISPFLI
ncbi:hypothetical protein ES708_26886 [subsurface metagenome]